MDALLVSEAILIYTGTGRSPFPTRSVERLPEHFDPVVAADLAAEVVRLDEEFYEVEPETGESLEASADRAAASFAERHPELTTAAVDALRWCYTYDWK